MSQTPPASLGIDVAKATFDAALLWEGKRAQRTFLMNPAGFTALDGWIHEHRLEQVHACLEATGEYGAALALALYEAGYQVSLVHPARIAADAKSRLARTKTDKSDAALIAHFCAQEHMCPGTAPDLDPTRCGAAGAAGPGPARRDAAGDGAARGKSSPEWRLREGRARLD